MWEIHVKNPPAWEIETYGLKFWIIPNARRLGRIIEKNLEVTMPAAKSDPNKGNLMINVFDGRRKPTSRRHSLLIRIIDGNQTRQFRGNRMGPNIPCSNLPVFDNFGDNYTVLVSAKGHCDAGFTPVKISRNSWQRVDLMLLPKDAGFNFSTAKWDVLQNLHPKLFQLLSSGTTSAAARKRYENLMENQASTLAAFFNIATAMSAIYLPAGTALDYVKQLIWDQMYPTRFFAYADKQMVNQVVEAAAHKQFAPEHGSGLLHPGATRSYKQVQFGEANVQLTFHEGDTKKIGGVDCVVVEPDIDYYRDIGAHALLEVIPHTVTGSRTDPKEVYVLRWIAGRHAGVPDFNPPYTIV